MLYPFIFIIYFVSFGWYGLDNLLVRHDECKSDCKVRHIITISASVFPCMFFFSHSVNYTRSSTVSSSLELKYYLVIYVSVNPPEFALDIEDYLIGEYSNSFSLYYFIENTFIK